jgi:DNA-directed RNA polymerase subunit H (RpoH/RPB5)
MTTHQQHIDISDFEKTEIIVSNVIKMLTDRGLLNPDDLDTNIKHYKQYTDPKHNLYIPVKTVPSGEIYHVKIFNHIVTTIKTVQEIQEFLNKYNEEKKIVIIESIKNKAYHQFMEFDKIEVFRKSDLMIHVMDHDLQPISVKIIRSKEEKQAYRDEYGIPDGHHSIIKTTDRLARHFNMQNGDIVKFVTANNGYRPNYRIVKYDIMDVNEWY